MEEIFINPEQKDWHSILQRPVFDNKELEATVSGILADVKLNGDDSVKRYSLHFDKAFEDKNISMELQLNLYRILQEQLKNIIKYAKATHIKVKVLLTNNSLMMEISDNGKGFDTNKVREGIGLANMKRRTELFLGKFNIVSSPGNGCTVTVTIPLAVIIDWVKD